MPNHLTTLLAPKPGISKDSTTFDSPNYTDGNWVRFYNSKPRKMGGYKLIFPGNSEIIRQIYVPPYSLTSSGALLDGINAINKSIIFIGRASTLVTTVIDTSGNTSPEVNRTPTSEFIPSINNTWSMDNITVVPNGDPTNYMFALLNPNINNVNGNIEGTLFYGIVNDTARLQPVVSGTGPGFVTASGFVLAVEPFVIVGGNEGVIRWSNENKDVTDWPEDNFETITNTKLIAGVAIRGGGGPTALIWSLNSLIRISYNTTITPANWNIDVIEDTITILSGTCVVKYKSEVYWVGIDQFYIYTGVVRELPNNMNKQYFFENLNINQRNKVWGTVIPQYNEIWWFAPFGDAEECNHAIIYNYAEGIWYNTSISRSCGYAANIFPYPLWADSVRHPNLSVNPPAGQTPAETYSIWMHEYGYDEQRYIYNLAINSYFVTNIITLFEQSPNNDFQFRTRVIEPDFNQRGQMTVQVVNRGYANSVPVLSDPIFFDSLTQKIDFEVMGRLVSYKFSSNTEGGFYQMGKVILQYLPGDQRPGS